MLINSKFVTHIKEGLPGVWENKGTLAKYQREQGNMSLLLGNRGTKHFDIRNKELTYF